MNIIGITVIGWMLISLFLGWNSFQKGNEIIHLEIKIDTLENTFSIHTISIGDTTLQIIRDFKIQDETNEILDIRRITPGKNIYYVELNNRTGLDLIYMK